MDSITSPKRSYISCLPRPWKCIWRVYLDHRMTESPGINDEILKHEKKKKQMFSNTNISCFTGTTKKIFPPARKYTYNIPLQTYLLNGFLNFYVNFSKIKTGWRKKRHIKVTLLGLKHNSTILLGRWGLWGT